MSHQRIIGLIVLGCLFLLVLPFLSSEHKIAEQESYEQEIIVPEVTSSEESLKEITLEQYNKVEPPTEPAAIDEGTKLIAPEIPDVTRLKEKDLPDKKHKLEAGKQKTGWYVQIASLASKDPIKIEALKSSLRKLKVSIDTEQVTVKGIKFTRIKTLPLADKQAAEKERNRINKSLSYDKIKAIVKKY